MSESSLQRFTPDSGIALNYQSSVSSVGSLSPPVDRTTRDDFGSSFQKLDEGKITESLNPAIQDSQSCSNSLPELGSNVVSSSMMAGTTCTTVASNRFPFSRISSAAASYPTGSTVENHKGTIPLSHAPFMQSPAMMMPSAGMHASASPGLVHSSHAVNRSPAPNAFQFNLPPAMMQQYSPGSSVHSNVNHGLSPGPSSGMYYPSMGSPGPMNMYNHSTLPVPPFASSPGMFPHSTLSQPPPYQPYPGSPAQLNQGYYPNTSPTFGQLPSKMVSPQKIVPKLPRTSSVLLNIPSDRASNQKSPSPLASGSNLTTQSSNPIRMQEVTQHSSSPMKDSLTNPTQFGSSLSSMEQGTVQLKASPTKLEQALSPEQGAVQESDTAAGSNSTDEDQLINSKR